MSGNQHLSKEKITYFKNRLLEMKKNIETKMNEANNHPNDTSQELTDFSNHPADMGTEQFEQERAAGFDMMAEEQLENITDALQRIQDGTYGISEVSGKPIPEERLAAIPTATMLVEEERKEEEK